MIENYIVIEKCPQCSKSLDFGWRFCGYCGYFIGELHPKCRLKHPLELLYGKAGASQDKSIKTPEFLGKVVGKVKEVVQQNLDEGEEIADKDFSPLIFTLTEDAYLVQKLTEMGEAELIFKDYKGYYVNKSKGLLLNNRPTTSSGKSYLFNGDSIRRDNQLQIFSIMNQEEVVWQHQLISDFKVDEDLTAIFEVNDGEVFVKPAEGYQILLNTAPLVQRAKLKNFDTLSIDYRLFVLINDKLIYQEPLTAEQRASVASNVHSIKGENLAVAIKERRAGEKLLLSDINFSVNPGEMVLILGGSGAGKTTLINAIMGSEKADARIRLGQKDVYKDFDQVRRMIAVVPQFSLHRERDSVYMTLKNAAEMKLPREFTMDSRLLEEKIDEVLAVTNLSHKREALVSELSGGEKKRLSIATEYIADPVVFILDEPDSGVDGPNARSIMESLRKIADDDKIVLLISHNPDRTPELFDKVLMLVKSRELNAGKIAFYGEIDEALDFYGTKQLEMAIALADSNPDDYIEKYQAYLENKRGD